MSTKKSFHSLLLALIMVFLMVPATVVTAHAAGTCGDNLIPVPAPAETDLVNSTVYSDGDLYYTVVDGEGHIVGYHGSGGEVTLPSKVRDYSTGKDVPVRFLNPGAFRNCTTITKVTFPSSVTEICDFALAECTGLASVSLSSGLTTIGYGAFQSCTALKSITIPSSVTSISGNPFSSCTALTAISVDSANGNYCSVSNVLFNKSKTLLIAYPVGKAAAAYSIPSSVTTIGARALAGCQFTSLTIPSSVTQVCYYSFCETTVPTLTVPSNVKTYEEYSFYCSNIDTLNIGSGTTAIPDGAFTFCRMGKLTLPSTLTAIGANAFQQCENLMGVTIPAQVTTIGENAFNWCPALTSLTIGKGVTSIGPGAFSATGLTNVTIPGNVTSLGSGAFHSCGNLAAVTISSGVKEISDEMFNYCTALTNVTIPGSVTKIGAAAFRDCYALKQIEFPTALTEIGDCAFWECRTLRDITFRGHAPSIGSCAFISVQASVYYPAGDTTWTEDVRQDYGGTLTWVPYASFDITSQPTDFTGPIGATASFTVEAAGEGLTYQWQYKSLKDGRWYDTKADGYNTPTMRIGVTAARNGMQFRCKVTNSSGETVTSNAATLYAEAAGPAITSQPTDFTGPIGATASFTVEAAGEGLTYQWQYKSLKDGKWYNANVDGSNTPTMHIGVTGNRDGMQFRCRITDASGSHLISDAATLRVG